MSFFQAFHIYTDRWWRDPEHAVTTTATLVEVRQPKRPQGTVSSGPYTPSPSGFFQEVWGDVINPATGALVRAHGDLYSATGSFQVGQTLKVRWSAKREEFDDYKQSTAPAHEWASEPAPAPLAGVLSSVIDIRSGGGGQTDPIEQLEKLAALHRSGDLTDEEFTQQKQRLLGEQPAAG